MATQAASRLLKNVNTSGLRWRLIDAKGQVLGRLASRLSIMLQGKDKPTYSPWEDNGDVVVVVNAKDVVVTGNKAEDKLYRWHTGYPGGLKTRTFREQMAIEPEEIIRKAVYGMLPKNKLRKHRARKLRVFAEGHDFSDNAAVMELLQPADVSRSNVRDKHGFVALKPGFEPLDKEYYERMAKIHLKDADASADATPEST